MAILPMTIAVLDDDPDRIEEVKQCLARHLPDYEVVCFDNAPDMIEWLASHLEQLRLICLDHDLGPNRRRADEVFDPGTGRDVADYLATHAPVCPVIVHTTNSLAAPGMELVLTDAGWHFIRVVPYGELEWIGEAWIAVVMQEC